MINPSDFDKYIEPSESASVRDPTPASLQASAQAPTQAPAKALPPPSVRAVPSAATQVPTTVSVHTVTSASSPAHAPPSSQVHGPRSSQAHARESAQVVTSAASQSHSLASVRQTSASAPPQTRAVPSKKCDAAAPAKGRSQYFQHVPVQNSGNTKRPRRKAAVEGELQRKSADAKSLNSPYQKLTPIVSEEDYDVDMKIDVECAVIPVQESTDVKDPVLHCMYCQDIGTYIWKCTNIDCGLLACVAKAPGDHGCVDATPDELTNVVSVDASTFRCPQCYRAAETPLPYKIRGYSVRQEFTFRNYFPLLTVFLSWSGFGREYASDIVRRTLLEHFHRVPSRLRLASRKLKAGNNRPSAFSPDFQWLKDIKYEGNLLAFIDTHSDTDTGNLVVAGNAADSHSVPVHELLHNYLGDNLRVAAQHIGKINTTTHAGPFIRGIVISSCGSSGRIPECVDRLKRLVEMNIFDFVFSFAGVSTVDSLVVPALSRFVENVFVYDMGIWAALEASFGEDKRALNTTPIMLSYAEYRKVDEKHNTRERIVNTRLLAYSNFKDARPWGLDIYQCSNSNCGTKAHDMVFHADGKQYFGRKWLKTLMKTRCLKCGEKRKGIRAPTWIYQCDGENLGRVWYNWPLSISQRMEIGITH